MDDLERPRPKILITKIGLDGHDRGSRIVAAFLRDAGMEVVYTPPWQSIEAVISTAIQEDVDVIGLSSLATDHLIIPELMKALRDKGLDTVRVVVGGIIPQSEVQGLLDAGVSKVLGPGAMRQEIVDTVESLACAARKTKRRYSESV